MTRYCPHCWAEVAAQAEVCPHCGRSLGEDAADFLGKLIVALQHPDPLTQRRAAFLLGRIRDPRAVAPLGAVLAGQADVYVNGEAAFALRAIGGERAGAILAEVADDPSQSIIVRRMAAGTPRESPRGNSGQTGDAGHLGTGESTRPAADSASLQEGGT